MSAPEGGGGSNPLLKGSVTLRSAKPPVVTKKWPDGYHAASSSRASALVSVLLDPLIIANFSLYRTCARDSSLLAEGYSSKDLSNGSCARARVRGWGVPCCHSGSCVKDSK